MLLWHSSVEMKAPWSKPTHKQDNWLVGLFPKSLRNNPHTFCCQAWIKNPALHCMKQVSQPQAPPLARTRIAYAANIHAPTLRMPLLALPVHWRPPPKKAGFRCGHTHKACSRCAIKWHRHSSCLNNKCKSFINLVRAATATMAQMTWRSMPHSLLIHGG